MRTALVRRAARRHPAHLHAAARDARGLPRAGRRRSKRPPRELACRCSSRATRRRTIRGSATFKVTPDPGRDRGQRAVRALAGDELVTQTERSTKRRAPSNLVAEKFELDGAHIGSGGGNHLVLGGATAGDSPFLRAPGPAREPARLLAQPSRRCRTCSRAASSARPRRRRASTRRATTRCYELELAFTQLPTRGEQCPPWLVDRSLRNLLVDVTGNTHRTEFCIDKLYSPDGPTGRLGLVELRAFEMPPHARMIVERTAAPASARCSRSFWEQPYQHAARASGARMLHDRFLLAVLRRSGLSGRARATCARAASASTDDWFEPHFEFRFPFYGQRRQGHDRRSSCAARSSRGTCSAKRARGGGAGALRRLVARARAGARRSASHRGRHLVTVQRRRAAAAPHRDREASRVRRALPRLAAAVVPAPDDRRRTARCTSTSTTRWNERRSPGCTYHVVHPGGRANVDRPSTPLRRRAGASRASTASGTCQGTFRAAAPRRSIRHFPMTLDLRRSRLHRDGSNRQARFFAYKRHVQQSLRSAAQHSAVQRVGASTSYATRRGRPRPPGARSHNSWTSTDAAELEQLRQAVRQRITAARGHVQHPRRSRRHESSVAARRDAARASTAQRVGALCVGLAAARAAA